MERMNLFMGQDGRSFEVPDGELDAFRQEIGEEPLRRVSKFRSADGRNFEVPEDEIDAFRTEMQGEQVDEVRSVRAGGKVFDVPESEAADFMKFYRNDPSFDQEHEQTAKGIAEKLDAPESPVWAGVKGFFSPGGYAENASMEGASAAAANVFRGVAQAPATIADKLGAAEQFQSRIRELPGMKVASAVVAPMAMTGLAGMGLEAILSLKGKDGGKEYRGLIQKARDYVDAKREEWLGFRNERGEQAGQGDFASTLGGQAVNAVAESYLLTAPKVMQGINTAMRAGGTGLASRLTPTLQTMLYGASTAEGTASKAEAKGMSNEKAVGLGMLTGTIESALESVSQVTGLQDAISKNALKEAVVRTVWRRAGEVLKDATGEGLTEFGQQAQQGTIEKLSGIDEKTWDQIGMESASAAALGIVSGGATASAGEVFNRGQGSGFGETASPAMMQDRSNTEVDDEQVRMQQEEAQAQGEQAARESVLGGEAQGQPEGAGAQPGGVDQQQAGGMIQPLQIAEGVTVEPVEAPRQVEPDPKRKQLPQVRIRLASGRQLYSSDPGLAALVEYWYKDRVLFPPAPAGDTGRQAGDVAMNASRRAGFEVKPAKRVWVNVGRSKKGYMGTVVQVLDGSTVRVKIDKTQRSQKNNRAGYADVDVRQIAQLASVVGRQNRDALTRGMPKEQRDRIDADARAFRDEIVDQGLFLDQETYAALDGMKGSKANRMRDELIKDAYRRASAMMGIPLDNHVQRAEALPILQEFHARMQGSEGMPYDAYAELAAREAEQETQQRRESGEFTLEDLTPEQAAQADAQLEAQRNAASQRAEIMRRAQAPIQGDAGDLTGIIPGMEDFAFDDTPLFGFDNGNSKLETGNLQEQRNSELQQAQQTIKNGKSWQDSTRDGNLKRISATIQSRMTESQKIVDAKRSKAAFEELKKTGNAEDYLRVWDSFQDEYEAAGIVDTGEELPFNMAPEYNVAPEAAGVYNQDTSGGADTPRAQEEAAGKTPFNTPPWMTERNAVGMDLMDAVSMVYQLTGKFPKVLESLRRTRALGYFDPNTKEVVLWAKIFGLIDDTDRMRIRKALEAKGFKGQKLLDQEAIEVKALMEKRRKENQKRPLKVAVHELAHLVDFLPDSVLKRGNILGHIAAFTKYMKHAIGPEPGAQGPLTEKERAELRARAEREMKALKGEARTIIEEVTREVPEFKLLGITPEDVTGLLGLNGQTATPELYDWFSRQETDVKREVLAAAMKGVIDERMAAFGRKEQVGTRTVRETVTRTEPGYTAEDGRRRFRELLKEETERRRLIELKRIKEEARKIIPWWRGVPEMETYFEKPEEMYAELMGIFLADQSELQRRAPTVYRAFLGWMDARPEVADAYRAFLDGRNMPADKQAAARLEALRRGMEKTDEDARREAQEMARKPGRWAAMDSFGYYFHRRTAPIKWALDRSLKTLLPAAKTEAEKQKLQDIYEAGLVGIKKQSAIGRVIQQYEMEINEKVARPLQAVGLDMLDLGVYQALRRVAFELDGKAAPAGVEPASALKLLKALEDQYGPEKWAELQQAATEFRFIRDRRILQNADLRAMFDKELLEKLDSNVEYVTFKHVPTMEQISQFKEAIRKAKSGDKLLREDVSEFLTGELENRLGSSVGAKIHKYVGSFGPVANPIVATLSKDDQLLRSATRNALRKQVYEFVKESGLDLIRDVQYEKNGRGMMVPKMVDDRNWKTVVYMEDGQAKGYLANRELAAALEQGTIDDIQAFRRVMRVNSFISRLYTQLKYSFSFFNNMRDVERAANLTAGMQRIRPLGVNINFIPGGAMISTLQRYGIVSDTMKKFMPKWMFNDKMIEWNLAQARRAAILIQTGTISQAEAQAKQMLQEGRTREAERLLDDVRLARAGLEKPILMSHIEAIREDSTADDYSRRLYKYGIRQEDLTAGARMAAKIRGVFPALGRTFESWGETGELTTKLATWKYLEKNRPDMSEAQRILMTRELGGSPDFSERGRAASYVEAVTSPFVNAAKEGTIGWAKAMKDRPGETSMKMFTNVIAPTMVRHMLSSGLAMALMKIAIPDDEEREGNWFYNFLKWYYDATRKVPNYILKNYNSFPLPMSKESEKFFTLMLRMPMDQTSQVVSLATWNMMDSLGETILDSINKGDVPTVLSRTENPWIEAGQEILNSVFPQDLGQAPILGLFGLIKGYLFGTNYYDSFKERDVFNEDELISRFKNWNATKTLAGEISNRLGGSMIQRYTPDNIWGEQPPSLHKWLNMPFIQPTVGAFLNVYTGGEAQMERKLKRIEKEMEAPIKVEAKNDFTRAVKEAKGGNLNFSEDIKAKWAPRDPSYKEIVRSQIYLEEFQRLTNEYMQRRNIKGDISDLMKISNEDNPLMGRMRMGLMDMRR